MDSTRSPRSSGSRKPHPLRRLEELERRDTPAFTALPPFTTQSVDPTVIATGDFDGDGLDDVAVANDGGGPGGARFVGIGLGNGDGSFTAGQQLTNVNFVFLESIITGDFNRDNKLDLAIGSWSSTNGGSPSGVLVALGNGDGTFQGPSLVLNLPTIALAAADFNGDQVPDLVAIEEVFRPTAIILLGNGDGTFTNPGPPVDLGTSSPNRVVAADFDGDGKQDFAIPDDDDGTDSLLVVYGNGDGTFGAPVGTDIADTPTDLVAGDFDADGKLDLVISADDTIYFHRNLGGRVFDTPGTQVLPPGAFVRRLASADFNGDGTPDVVAINTADVALVAISNRDGTFTADPGSPYSPNQPPGADGSFAWEDVTTGDFDGDGNPDFVTLGENTSLPGGAGGDVLLNLAPDFTQTTLVSDPNPSVFGQTVTLTATVAPVVPPFPPSGPLTGTVTFFVDGIDFGQAAVVNGVATLPVNNLSLGSHTIIARYSGDPAFRTSDSTPITQVVQPIPTQTTLTSSLNPSRESQGVTFTATVTPTFPPPSPALVPTGSVTFTIDGVNVATVAVANGVATFTTDTLATGPHQVVATFTPGGTRVITFAGSASAPLTQVVRDATRVFRYEVTGLPTGEGGTVDRVASGEFTGDGIPDIVIGSGIGAQARATVIDGNSRQAIARVQPFGGSFFGGVLVAAGDVNNDGVDDLAVTADTSGGPRVQVYLSQGGQLVLAADFIALDPGFRGGLRVALGDVNRDGAADLVVTPGEGGGPRVATYDGRTLFGGAVPTRLWNDFFAFEENSRLGAFVAVGDLDGDGDPEIIVGADKGGGPRVAVLDGAGLILTGQPTTVANFFSGDEGDRGGVRVAARDLDGDGLVEFFTGAGFGDGSTVRVYDGAAVLLAADPVPLLEIDVFPGLTSGVYVA